MIDPGLLLAFAASVTLLMLIPGPNVALIVANSVTYGPRHGLMTVAGTVAAQALGLLSGRGRLGNRLTGGILVGAGTALALLRSR